MRDLSKFQMPSPKSMEEEAVMEDESGEMEQEEQAGMDLSALSDDELLAEAKKRGIIPSDEVAV